MAQELHAKDEKVRGKGTVLYDTSRGKERIKAATIKEKGSGHRGDTADDELNEVLWEIKKGEHLPNKALLNSVIGFL